MAILQKKGAIDGIAPVINQVRSALSIGTLAEIQTHGFSAGFGVHRICDLEYGLHSSRLVPSGCLIALFNSTQVLPGMMEKINYRAASGTKSAGSRRFGFA
jgi:hypothetical protein